MAYDSWQDVWGFFKRYFVPDFIIKRRLNFLTLHYFYMIGMIILFSVIMFGIGEIPYIDALFFAAGGSTQSGLNTIDVNKLHTGQQVCLYLLAMFCNPISIHTFVVFVRLYWFEKRFRNIVHEARVIRRTKSRSRTNTVSMDDMDGGRQEMGVRGRAIHVLRNTGHAIKSRDASEQGTTHVDSKPAESASSSEKGKDSESQADGKLDLPRSRSSEEIRLPQQLSPEQHIRFLEAQRNPSDVPLRIPSPREFDRGGKPEELGNGSLARRVTSNLDQRPPTSRSQDDSGARLGAHITIDEPQIHRTREKTNTFPRGQSRQRTNPNELEPPRPLSQTRKRTTTFGSFRRSNTAKSVEPTPYLSWQPTIGRNSFFVDLTEEQREELGGIEYRSLKTLALVLVMYFFGFHVLGVISLTPWIMETSYYGDIVRSQGLGRVWWGFFSGGSAFNDLGFTLTNNSMTSFRDAVWPMLIMTFLIIIGNTGFPCMLRFIIWLSSKLVPVGSGVWEELRFLLDHPRRCFTLLFPSAATWWLFAILVILNGVDLIFFIVLDLNDPVVTSISPGIRVLDGLFQAASTRTAGFSVVNLAELHPAIQVSYLIMMYISVFPIAISMRRTNVYEEKSLGIYANPGSEEEENNNEPSYVGAHLRKQLSFDLWYVFLGMFIIAIVEGNRLENTNEYAFTLFSVLFEIVSAYGTVGLSLGYPTINASFSAEFQTLSKLVIIAMMVRGRHRGLPYALDRAVLLPSESLQAKEAREGKRMLSRRRSSLGAGSTYATEGQLETQRFRAETGLTSGYEHENSEKRSDNSEGQVAQRHQSHARKELGQAMYKLASTPETVKDVGQDSNHHEDTNDRS